ncbi:MAG: ferrous iron transport protein [Oscillospiraceae bacterium]|nr:ferrous iron transport protein [Oscillospiraceae bacterium]
MVAGRRKGADMGMKIALAGNPNCGKTTMFNDLTGSAQYVGNWPGVTVEQKEGRLRGNQAVILQDLPGIYSLSPYTAEEMVTRTYLVKERPDAIIDIIDGTNIERNLYLSTQLLELGIPMVIAVNMIDVVRKRGDSIDLDQLARALGCPVMETSALKGEGSVAVARRAVSLAGHGGTAVMPRVFQGAAERAVLGIEKLIRSKVDPRLLRWYAVKLFERDGNIQEELGLDAGLNARMEGYIAECELELDDDARSIVANQRYEYITGVVKTAVTRHSASRTQVSERIDRVVTNRLLALPIFAAIMFAVYFVSVTSLGKLATDFMNHTLFNAWIIPWVRGVLEQTGCADWLAGLVMNGIISGVGSVLRFVPQMFLLFLMLSLLEDCGYMSRVAFIMDKVFRQFGLSGKSFIPMLIGSGCSVPGIMAARTIERERDRRMTIMTTSFIPCGAKMPIIALIAGALFDGAWWVAPLAYAMGVASVAVSGVMLKKTRLFAGSVSPFVMELPSYHLPTAKTVLRSTWERGWSFLKRAGTVILLASIGIWFLSSFGFQNGSFGLLEGMDHSILATIGGIIAPVFTPLGFGTWEAAVASLMGLMAKEELVGVFGVLYGSGAGGAEGIAAHFTPLSGFAFLMFNLLCAPCIAAMSAIHREMNSDRWTAFALSYLCVYAYCVSLIVYQVGLLCSGGGFTVGTGAALAVLSVLLCLILRPDKLGSGEMKKKGRRF